MSGFVSTPPVPASSEGATVAADGWFPDIDVNAIRDTIRMGDGIVTHPRLIAAIEGGIITALRPDMLGKWQAEQITLGHASLEAVPDTMLGGKSCAVMIWERIIRYYAAAEIADLYRDVSATDKASLRGDTEMYSANDYRRMAHAAIADLKSTGALEAIGRNRFELV